MFIKGNQAGLSSLTKRINHTMAVWHLDQIESKLQQKGWSIKSRELGNDYDISSTWIIKRSVVQHIDFEGLDDMQTLPIEKSYGCHIRDKNIDLYFHKKGPAWDNALNKFVDLLNQLD